MRVCMVFSLLVSFCIRLIVPSTTRHGMQCFSEHVSKPTHQTCCRLLEREGCMHGFDAPWMITQVPITTQTHLHTKLSPKQPPRPCLIFPMLSYTPHRHMLTSLSNLALPLLHLVPHCQFPMWVFFDKVDQGVGLALFWVTRIVRGSAYFRQSYLFNSTLSTVRN